MSFEIVKYQGLEKSHVSINMDLPAGIVIAHSWYSKFDESVDDIYKILIYNTNILGVKMLIRFF